MKQYDTIEVASEAGVATVTLNRPERRNAWTPGMAADTNDAFRRLDADDDVRAVVVTGAGEAFCAGADLGGADAFADQAGESGGAGDSTVPWRDPTYWRELVSPWSMRKPVVAAVNGHAVGVGATFALQCDLRFVAADAKVAFSFVRRGVLAELASHVLLPRLVGTERAADLLLSGRTITGAEAAAMGLASAALPRDEVVRAAVAWARDVAASTAPVSVALSKRLLWEGLTASPAEMLRREQELLPWLCNQVDAVEGVASFLEKRTPQWSLGPRRDLPLWPTP
jgi:enoyl-CoA hydratase/carnithine racemase